MKITVEEIIKAVGGELLRGSMTQVISGVSTDSRTVLPNEVFFALRGPNFDGHRFVKDVFSKGASAAVLDRAGELPDKIHPSQSVIFVKDTLPGLGDLASFIRRLHNIPVIAVSGSAGKTTTKEMIASILERSRPVLKTEGNMNNLVGLPLTLFRLDNTHKAAVIELGISESWEMERLAAICRPDIALITNIGRSHLKTLGSLEGVARAKGPLFTSAREGVKVVNLDDPWVVRLSEGKGRIVTYSMAKEADVRVEGYKADENLGVVDAVYRVRGEKIAVRFNSPGAVNVLNGAAAIAATLPLETSLKDMREGLNSFSTVHGRMEVLRIRGITVLDDTYNANPESVSSALMTLKNAAGRKVAVLGDMLELGEASKAEHKKIGTLAAELGIDVVVAVGEWSKDVTEGALEAEKGRTRALFFRDKAGAIDALKGLLKEGDCVLVKGSRATALEEVVERLKTAGLRKACI